MSAKKVFAITLFVLLILGIAIYRYRAGGNKLNVDPHADREIEKAKQR
ncbi:MAG: hypothetical protein ABI833_10485 [Acidobacteriota bacterium]